MEEIKILSNIDQRISFNRYDKKDDDIIISRDLEKTLFYPGYNFIEYHVFDDFGNALASDLNYRLFKPDYSSLTDDGSFTTLSIDPIEDLKSRKYNKGRFTVIYNFLSPAIDPNFNQQFFIKEISRDRTEIRISSNFISNTDISTEGGRLVADIATSMFYKDYIANFGKNNLQTVVNIAVDRSTEPYTILLKLYKPLPADIVLNDVLTLNIEVAFSRVYVVSLSPEGPKESIVKLQGPNFDIDLDNKQSSPTDYGNFSSLTGYNNITTYQQILNEIEKKNISINIDYTNFSNFVHFSSAKERLLNFRYKLKLIELYQNNVNQTVVSGSSYVVSSSNSYQDKINDIIKHFDGYEYFLYFTSGSYSWPKSNSSAPYVLYNTTSSQALTWLGSEVESDPYFGGILKDAYLYDRNNVSNLEYTIPEFIKNNNDNESYSIFVNMIGHHFDNIWVYLKSLTDIYNNNSNLNLGISKDLISDVLKSFGVKLYNTNPQDSLFEYYLGLNNSGSQDFGHSTFETLITASSQPYPRKDISAEIQKRLYHNLPLLLKSKGTAESIRVLAACYGIPDTILRVTEFGGSDKESNTVEYSENIFNYSLEIPGSGSKYIFVPGGNWNSTLAQEDIELRFKISSGSFTTSSKANFLGLSVGNNRAIPGADEINFTIEKIGSSYYLLASGSGLTSPVSSSIGNNIDNITDTWYSFYVGKGDDPNTRYVYLNKKVNNKVVQLITGSSLSFNNDFDNYNIFVPGLITNNNTVSMSFQEFRIWDDANGKDLTVDDLYYHTLNPLSIENRTYSGSYHNLYLRFPLGSDLFNYPYTQSTHPSQSRYPFINTSYSASFNNINSSDYKTNTELVYVHYPNVGSSKPMTDKIYINSGSILDNLLDTYIRLESIPSESKVQDYHFVDVSLSPTKEINDNITEQIGYFNIDEYIGDPRMSKSGSYSELDNIKNFYYKNKSKFSYFDYIRIIKYFDNSLFKMIKDFVPARANVSTGITIQSPILERNKIKRNDPAVTVNYNSYSQSIGISEVSSDSGGVFENLGINAVHLETISTISGSVDILISDNRDYYNGELNDSEIQVTKGNISSGSDYYGVFSQYIDDNPYYTNVKVYNKQSYLDIQTSLYSNDNPVSNNINDTNASKNASKIYYEGATFKVSNFSDIVSQSAEKADVADYLFNNAGLSRGRYEGSKLVGQKYNKYTSGDISYGKEAVIDSYTDYIAFFDWSGGSSPEVPGGTNFHLVYLLDKEGNRLPLDGASNSNLFIINQIFKPTTTASIQLLPKNVLSNPSQLVKIKCPIKDSGIYYASLLAATSSFALSLSTSSLSYSKPYFNYVSDSSLEDMGDWVRYLTTSSSLVTNIALSYGGSNNVLDIWPLQENDIIRLFRHDSNFDENLGEDVFTKAEIIVNNTVEGASKTTIYSKNEIPVYFSGAQSTNQGMRIYRRIPNESFVVSSKYMQLVNGLLIPENYNPNLNPLEVARKAGLL